VHTAFNSLELHFHGTQEYHYHVTARSHGPSLGFPHMPHTMRGPLQDNNPSAEKTYITRIAATERRQAIPLVSRKLVDHYSRGTYRGAAVGS